MSENKEKAKGKKEALQELLRILSDQPDVADRITITIRPDKLMQGDAEETDK